MSKPLGTFVALLVLSGCGSSAATEPAAPQASPPASDPAPASPAAAGDTAPGGDAGHGSTPVGGDICDHLATTCHEHAGGSALLKECHELGHAGDLAKCGARHDECMAACEAAAKKGAHPANGTEHKH